MALDEALLQAAAAQGTSTLRFYRWREPTLSLGYFQTIAARTTHASSRHCPLVRRTTGGGAILHDQEWTYSLTAPAGSPLSVDGLSLYRPVHQALIDALAEQGLAAYLCDRPASPAGGGSGPFLCFQRRAPGDVLLGDAKIAGSAQRRRRGALLQHGSLILRTSAAAPEVNGLCELAERDIDEERLRLAWQAGIAQRLGLRLTAGEVTAQQHAAAEQLAREKYGRAEWTEKR